MRCNSLDFIFDYFQQIPTMDLEEITFSGWTAIEEKKLHAGEKPKDEKVYTMYHGTFLKYVQRIITSGFQRSSDGMLGSGVYVSRNIDKAKCYPLNADKKEAVVLKLKVRVGKVKKIDIDNHPLQKSWHQNGYDSCWVPPNCGVTAIKSGREEDCVWDPARIVVVDVACCLDDKTRWDLRKQIRGMNNHGAKTGAASATRIPQTLGLTLSKAVGHATNRFAPFRRSICATSNKATCTNN